MENLTRKRYASAGPIFVSIFDRFTRNTINVTTKTIILDITEAEYLTDVNCDLSFCVLAISGIIAKCETCTIGHPI